MRILIKEAELQGLLIDSRVCPGQDLDRICKDDNPEVLVESEDGEYMGILSYDEEGDCQIEWDLPE